MEAILKYKLPEEKEEFNGAVKAFEFWDVLYEYSEFLRGIVKYGYESGYDIETVEKLQKHFLNTLDDHRVTLEEFS